MRKLFFGATLTSLCLFPLQSARASSSFSFWSSPAEPSNQIPHFIKFDKPGEGSFSSLFEKNPKHRTVTVNAGNKEKLWVGGSGINGAFAKLLETRKQDVSRYSLVHRQAFNRASERKMGQKVIFYNVNSYNYVKTVAAFAPNLDRTTGFICLDSFRSRYRIHDHKNVGMLYVVGPKGKDYQSKKGFLKELERIGANLLDVVQTHNLEFNISTKSVDKLDPEKWELSENNLTVEEVRICLVSGGIYRHEEATKVEVAKALLRGLLSNHNGKTPRMTFMYDENAFERAYLEIQDENLKQDI